MSRFPVNPFLLVIFGLAVIGLGYQLVTDPFGFLMYILVGTAVAAGLYLLFTRVLMKRSSVNQFQKTAGPKAGSGRDAASYKKYQKAVKQQNKNKSSQKGSPRTAGRRRKDHNLTVIEGRKNRKKNRALF
ncbi:SA1362 family protein [Salibacterium lacus]|uniref:SA1362 family protein n=1 Tax=Salibacterium lacus TaxID=1898109 RepID=A0ABW5SYD0_9BACI